MKNSINQINLACALITNNKNEMLVVRKKNSVYFMMAGGKIQAKETSKEALIRELQEELQINITTNSLLYLGKHSSKAVNEENTIVNAQIFHLALDNQLVIPSNEIIEACWINTINYHNYKLANLIREFSIPKWLDINKKKPL
ncbi:NUDIX hydrolase [Myroides sp. LJL119]